MMDKQLLFQSTPSAWRETVHLDIYRSVVDISIHSLRMEGDNARHNILCTFRISIHSLRMEGDVAVPVDGVGNLISIHSLRMEGDPQLRGTTSGDWRFQSTPSAWRETNSDIFHQCPAGSFQSTPSAWRETNQFL